MPDKKNLGSRIQIILIRIRNTEGTNDEVVPVPCVNHPGWLQGLDKGPADGLALGHVHHLGEALLCDQGVQLLHLLIGQGRVGLDIDVQRLLHPLPG